MLPVSTNSQEYEAATVEVLFDQTEGNRDRLTLPTTLSQDEDKAKQELAAALVKAEERHKQALEEMAAKMKEQDERLSELMAEKLQLTENVQEDFMMQEASHQEEMAMLREDMMSAFDQKKKEVEQSSNAQKELHAKLQAVEAQMANTKVSVEIQIQEKIQRNLEVAMENELVCQICIEYFVQATSLNCSHTFCAVCITKWLNQKQGKARCCPQCRQSVTSSVRSLALDNHIDHLMENMPEEARNARSLLKEQRKEMQETLLEHPRQRYRNHPRHAEPLANSHRLVSTPEAQYYGRVYMNQPHAVRPQQHRAPRQPRNNPFRMQ